MRISLREQFSHTLSCLSPSVAVAHCRATRSLLLPAPRAPTCADVSLSLHPPPLFFLPARRVPGMSAATGAKCSQRALGGGGGERGGTESGPQSPFRTRGSNPEGPREAGGVSLWCCRRLAASSRDAPPHLFRPLSSSASLFPRPYPN